VKAYSSISQADADGKCVAAGGAALTGTGIAGAVGSACAFTYVTPQARILDLDKAGYVAWWAGRVQCTLAGGKVENIAGLSKAAFTATGNGFTATAMEDMVTGTSATDLAPTYTLQIYRKFASAAVTTATQEVIAVSGVDSTGRTITAKGLVGYGASYAMDDMWHNGRSGTTSATRTIDADGMGYAATLYMAAYYSSGTSTSSACPTTPSQPVKDYPAITVNSRGLEMDRRHCLYTNLNETNFYNVKKLVSATDNTGNWAWFFGPDTGTPVSNSQNQSIGAIS
jgi:hypothetical protein